VKRDFKRKESKGDGFNSWTFSIRESDVVLGALSSFGPSSSAHGVAIGASAGLHEYSSSRSGSIFKRALEKL